MSLKTFVLPLIVAAIPLTLSATSVPTSRDDLDCHHNYGAYYRGYRGYGYGWGNGFYGNGMCLGVNRDGITCGQVGYAEGQTGVPWGFGGVFVCENGCLKWIGPSE